MKVVVTGGNGLVGRYVVSELVESALGTPAHEVTVFDRYRRRRVPQGVVQALGDHGSLERLLQVFEGADAVLHLSALQPAAATTEDVYGKNVQGTVNVFEAAVRCGVKRVVNWSSVWALGWSTPGNTFLPDYLPIDESHPLRATDAYGRAKIEGEAIAESFHGRDGLEAVTLRPVFTATPAVLERLWGTQGLRNPNYSHLTYVDARDHAAAAHLALVCRAETHAAVYLAADDSRVGEPLCDLLPRLHPEIGNRADSIVGSRAAISNQLAASLLGWKPQYSWRELGTTARARGRASALLHNGVRAVAPNRIKKLWRDVRRET